MISTRKSDRRNTRERVGAGACERGEGGWCKGRGGWEARSTRSKWVGREGWGHNAHGVGGVGREPA
eukprot:898598-Pleurochrysis_carterae.AAC.1